MEQLMQYDTLNFSEAVNRATNRIFQLTGRARRSEYWWTILLVFIVSMAVPFAAIVLNLLTIPLTFRRLHDTGRSGWWWGVRFVGYFIFVCLSIGDILDMLIAVPSLNLFWEQFYSFAIKQLFWMIGFVVYHIVFIVILCLDGDQGINEYGESEKYFIEVTGEEK